MPDATEAGGMPVNRHVVGRIREDEARLLPTKERGIASWVPGIAAQEEMVT